MERVALPNPEGRGFEALEALWILRTAMLAVEEEHELAHLTTSSIPALLPCHTSGIALRQESEARWSLMLQNRGQILAQTETDALLMVCQQAFEDAIGQGTLLCTRAHDAQQSSHLLPALERLEVHSLLSVPLLTLHTQVGILLVGRDSSEPFSLTEVYILQTLAECLAVMAQNLRQHQRHQHYIHRLESGTALPTAAPDSMPQKYRALRDITQASHSHQTWTERFRAIAQTLAHFLPFEQATLTLYDPRQDILKVCAREGTLPRLVDIGLEVTRQHSLWGWVFEHRQPLVRQDLLQERQFPIEDLLLSIGLRSYMVVPLLGTGKTLGTLNIGSMAPGRYGEAEVNFLQEMAMPIAMAVENLHTAEAMAALQGRLQEESILLQEEGPSEPLFPEIIGESRSMKKLLRIVQVVAKTDTTVLILGETGTGKELIAHALHRLSPRQQRPLIKVNCASLPAGLIESELFGHEQGAFTSAVGRKIGRFELAHNGTIFLDEIGDLPLELQAKLLRVLQEGEFERLGGSQTMQVNVRVIAATNLDLEQAMREGKFRPDLYYRLHVFPIFIPPLRKRPQDIPPLVRYFIAKYSAKLGKKINSIPLKTMASMLAYSWPGNVRELRNVIERSVILTPGSQFVLDQWRPTPESAPDGTRIPTLEELERQHIVAVLERTGWQVSGEKGAARLLGVKPTTLEARMKKLAIQRKTDTTIPYLRTTKVI